MSSALVCDQCGAVATPERRGQQVILAPGWIKLTVTEADGDVQTLDFHEPACAAAWTNAWARGPGAVGASVSAATPARVR